jgi:hypothetical protein
MAGKHGRQAATPLRALQQSTDRFVVMSDRPEKSAEKMSKEQRLSRALRENLKRRKAQVKGRTASQTQRSASHDSAGIADDKQEG